VSEVKSELVHSFEAVSDYVYSINYLTGFELLLMIIKMKRRHSVGLSIELFQA
jgi:hypothetical protein